MTYIQKSGGFGTSVETRYETQHKARAIDDICFIFYAAVKGSDCSNVLKKLLNDMPTNDADELAFLETDYIIEQAINHLANLDDLKYLRSIYTSSSLMVEKLKSVLQK